MQEYIEVSCGYEGPTDCCLDLTYHDITKSFAIEGSGWQIIDLLLPCGPNSLPRQYGDTSAEYRILKHIFNRSSDFDPWEIENA